MALLCGRGTAAGELCPGFLRAVASCARQQWPWAAWTRCGEAWSRQHCGGPVLPWRRRCGGPAAESLPVHAEPVRRGGRRVGQTPPRRGSAAHRRGGGGRPGVAVPPALLCPPQLRVPGCTPAHVGARAAMGSGRRASGMTGQAPLTLWWGRGEVVVAGPSGGAGVVEVGSGASAASGMDGRRGGRVAARHAGGGGAACE